jgi:imidazoleglycerol-phosphate dehydratase
MIDRTTKVERKTKETEVKIFLNLDGKGESKINTPYPFLDHMLSLFAHHGFFDLEIYAKGDTEIDYHHLVEDVGICLGKAVKNALGEKEGIKRYGNCFIPMDDVLVQVVVDISGRPMLVFNFPSQAESRASNLELAKEFFQGFSSHSCITLHINVCYGDGVHHLMEAIFKAFGISLDEATSWEHRRRGVPSTKETLE